MLTTNVSNLPLGIALMHGRSGDERGDPEVNLATIEFAKMLDVDKIEGQIASLPNQIERFEYKHEFFPGLYVRTIFMPAGSLLTSKIHKTRHPFVVLEGQALMWGADSGAQHIMAPYRGATEPGTRRILYILEGCVWSTFHPITEDEFENLEKIEERIIQRNHNPHLATQVHECLKN